MADASPTELEIAVAELNSAINALFLFVCTAFVFLMIAGLALFYSGSLRSKDALSMVVLSFGASAIGFIQWWLYGHSLASNASNNGFIGSLEIGLFYGDATWTGEEWINAVFGGVFAMLTPVLIVGAGAGRARIAPTLIFCVLWSTLVFYPVFYWTWGSGGWAHDLGVIDFAGGSPVHVSSGVAALAYALVVGKRSDMHAHRPMSLNNVCLGTFLLWFGWMGFNGGSAFAPNADAMRAVATTFMAASAGGITWMLFDYRLEGKFNASGICGGIIAGLICITPSADQVHVASSLIIGVIAGIVCNLGVRVKVLIGIDDTLDVFALHGLGGIVGNLLAGFFSFKSGYLAVTPRYEQPAVQLAETAATTAYSFAVSYVLLLLISNIPGMHLCLSADEQDKGVDNVECGENMFSLAPDALARKHNFADHLAMSQRLPLVGNQEGTVEDLIDAGSIGSKTPGSASNEKINIPATQ